MSHVSYLLMLLLALRGCRTQVRKPWAPPPQQLPPATLDDQHLQQREQQEQLPAEGSPTPLSAAVEAVASDSGRPLALEVEIGRSNGEALGKPPEMGEQVPTCVGLRTRFMRAFEHQPACMQARSHLQLACQVDFRHRITGAAAEVRLRLLGAGHQPNLPARTSGAFTRAGPPCIAQAWRPPLPQPSS